MSNWIKAGESAQIAPGEAKNLAGVTIFNHDGNFHACQTRCPHMGHPMSKGIVRDGVVTCAWHKWEFDLATGGCYRGANDDLQVFPIKIEDGAIWIERAPTSPALERQAQRLGENMMEGDIYLQAKAIARLLAGGAAPARIMDIASAQAFRHSIAAHQNVQAAVELRALANAGRLSAGLSEEDQVEALLQGTRIASGPSGERPAVEPLPGRNAPARLRRLLATYVQDASPLGIERVLLTMPRDPERDALLLDLATRPIFIPHREVFLAVAACLDAGSVLGEDAHPRIAAILGWSLGIDRQAPDAEQREAMSWLDEHSARIAACAEGRQQADVDTVALLLDAPRIAEVFARLLALIVSGSSWQSILDGFSLFAARRFSRLKPNNGGLWGSAALSLRLCHALRQAGSVRAGAFRLQGLFSIAFQLHESRWLPSGTPWSDLAVTGAPDWKRYHEAFAALDRTTATACAIHLLAREADRGKAAAHWITPLLREDQNAAQLDTLAAVVAESSHLAEWQPCVAGMIGYALDMKNAQNVHAAAMFGKSFA